MFTSGTTGRPKGALLTHGNHWWSAIGSALNLGLQAHDRWLACLPLFHIGGLSILMRSVIYGIPVVFPEAAGRQASGFDPEAVNRTIAAEGVTIISVVSTMLQRMLEAQGNRPYPPALRCVLLGGAPAPHALLEECARRGIPVVQSYGLTESASQVATLAPADALRKRGSAGRPLLPNELRIAPVQATDEDVPGVVNLGSTAQPPDLEGEILVRGPSVTPGYLPPDGHLAAPQSAVDADGWLHTGDVGYLDREGYLYVLDRRADLIISGGENVYPAEVEAVLLSHAAIAEAAVYGLQDERWGQRVAAVVVPRPDAPLDQAELIAFCRARLAGYKVPTSLRIVQALPRNAAGKLLRRVLRENADG
jgi:O-succinylbenzoic acid--CoA ligase